jgi:hypothetical protein
MNAWTDPALFGRREMPPREELRFYRLIEERDGPVLTLACEHIVKLAQPPPAKQQYAFCEMCQRNFREGPL